MTWLLLRQHRSFVIATAVALGVFAVAVVVTGVHMADVYRGAGSCADGRCVTTGRLFQGYGAIIDTVHLTIVVPVLLAGFGATLLAARPRRTRTSSSGRRASRVGAGSWRRWAPRSPPRCSSA